MNLRVDESIRRARSFLSEELWSAAPARRSWSRAVRLLQFCMIVGQGFVNDQLLLRASALTYFTVLSLVPLVAVAVAIVGSIGVGSERFVELVVGTVAAGSPEVQDRIADLIARANFAGLGTLGAATLFLTTVLGIGNVESALNGIWGVKHERPWRRRLPDYLAVLVIAPLLAVTAISLSTTLRSEWIVQRMLEVPGFAVLYDVGLQQAPAVMLSLAFAFLYWFLPNTPVRVSSAIVGGIPTGFLIVIAQGLYLDFSVGVARANAFFGSFAALPLLFVWIYVFWAIALFGAEIAFAYQNLDLYRREVTGGRAGAAEREAAGLRIALEVARRFQAGAPPLGLRGLSEAIDEPIRKVREVVDQLEAANLLAPRASDGKHENAYLLARPAEAIAVSDVLVALRGRRDPVAENAPLPHAVDAVLQELDAVGRAAAGGRTLAVLLEGLPRAAEVDPPRSGG